MTVCAVRQAEFTAKNAMAWMKPGGIFEHPAFKSNVRRHIARW
jgi:hypothetical protein